MTWPMHDAGPTTPEPGAREPGPPEPGPEEPEPDGRAGHAGDTDPLPPLEGPMPGGPSPAETTLPLALGWPAPPTRPARVPRFTPFDQPDSVDAPPGWRRVPRPGDHRPPGDLGPRPDDLRPRYPQPGYRPPPGGPAGPGGPPGGPPAGPPAGPPSGPARGPRPSRTAGQRALPRTNLIRSGTGMAVGTLLSRGTGFLRTLVLTYAVGVSFLGNAYNNANTLPNTVYYLMLGGIFTSVVVPLLVRAARRDPDRGEAYAQRMFTLGAVALLVVTVVATLLAGPLVDLYAPTIHGPPGSAYGAEHHLMVIWAYFFIPQIFFYGMSSLIGALLNTRGRFAAPMWTPVINNVVVIVVGGLYVAAVGLGKTPQNISAFGVEVLGIGTTLGVVAQTVALFPSLRGAGFRWHPTLGFRRGEVSEMGRMAGWMSVYVISQWAGNLVVQIVANAASPGVNGYSAYSIAWQLFQLPYAIIGISVITALLPRMSEHASARRYSLVRDDFSIGVRLASVVVVPAAIYLGLLGGPLAEVLFSYGSVNSYHARYIGEVFGLFSLGLVPYMLTQLQLRVFYSFQDSRTASLVGVLTMAVSIAGAYVALSILPRLDVVAGLGVAYGISNLTGAIVGWALLLRRVGSLDGRAIARSLTRMHVATVPGLVFAVAVMIGAEHVTHNPGVAYGLLVTVVGGGGAVLLYALSARALRVAEFGFLARTVAARFGGQSRRH
ncbi:MAG TPA: murein biosynthesis integral membrane protein MurJ [Streptosporangiaceae bacterium]|nr:murein biosynthesis integral membrane protein MurJ [Streptosporangiaceae bacterium]